MLRRLVKAGLARAAHWTGVDRVVGALNGSAHLPVIIGYHSVVEDFAASAAGYMPPMLISRRMLEHQLDWLGRRYRFISLDELGARLESGEPFEKPAAAVTFDDGYRDFYDLAFPLLQRKGIPSAVFVVTDLVGTPHLQVYDKLYLLLVRALSARRSVPFDLPHVLHGLGIRLPAIEQMRHAAKDPYEVMRALYTMLPQAVLSRVIDALEADIGMEDSTRQEHHSVSWDMLATMHRAGVVIGCHSKTHAILPNEDRQSALEQTMGSRQDLENKLGIPVRHFAYPNGSFNAAAVSAVADAGYRFAYTVCPHRDPNHPLLTIPRKLLWEQSCLDVFGGFSPSIMSCFVHGVFDFAARCVEDHGWPGTPPPSPRKAPRDGRGGKRFRTGSWRTLLNKPRATGGRSPAPRRRVS